MSRPKDADGGVTYSFNRFNARNEKRCEQLDYGLAGLEGFFLVVFFLFFGTWSEFWPSVRTEGATAFLREGPRFGDDPIALLGYAAPSSENERNCTCLSLLCTCWSGDLSRW
jgi:hypothetical protein